MSLFIKMGCGNSMYMRQSCRHPKLLPHAFCHENFQDMCNNPWRVGGWVVGCLMRWWWGGGRLLCRESPTWCVALSWRTGARRHQWKEAGLATVRCQPGADVWMPCNTCSGSVLSKSITALIYMYVYNLRMYIYIDTYIYMYPSSKTLIWSASCRHRTPVQWDVCMQWLHVSRFMYAHMPQCNGVSCTTGDPTVTRESLENLQLKSILITVD